MDKRENRITVRFDMSHGAAMKKMLLAAGLLAFATAPASAADIVIVQKGRAFHPTEASIAVGDRLIFTNEDNYIHQIYVTGLFDSDEKSPGENLNESFTRAGTFQVRCHIHPTMKMVVRVK
jgi:plastocyanin